MKQIILIYLLFQLTAFAQNDSNISVVSLEKVNVVYRGITNPIKIAVPGAKSFKAQAPGKFIKVDSLGNFNWNVTGVAGLKAIVEIDITMDNNSNRHEEKVYEIKPINKIIGSIDSDFEYRTYEMTYDQLKNLNIKTTIQDFNYAIDTAYFRVEHFKIEIQGEETIWVKGNKLHAKIFNLLKDLPIGTELFITDIYTYNPNQYDLADITSIKVKIVDSVEPKPVILSNNQNYNNIIYRGIENQLRIEVPGAKSFIVKATGLSKMMQDSTYTINVTNIKEDKLKLDFTVYNFDGSVATITEHLYIKNITPKKITLNDKSCKSCVLKLTLDELKSAVLDIKVDDAEESWSNMHVWSFTIMMPNRNVLEISGNTITNELLTELSKLSKNSVVEVNIPYYGSKGVTCDPQPLKIMIIK